MTTPEVLIAAAAEIEELARRFDRRQKYETAAAVRAAAVIVRTWPERHPEAK